jgi:hypothetical protein
MPKSKASSPAPRRGIHGGTRSSDPAEGKRSQGLRPGSQPADDSVHARETLRRSSGTPKTARTAGEGAMKNGDPHHTSRGGRDDQGQKRPGG